MSKKIILNGLDMTLWFRKSLEDQARLLSTLNEQLLKEDTERNGEEITISKELYNQIIFTVEKSTLSHFTDMSILNGLDSNTPDNYDLTYQGYLQMVEENDFIRETFEKSDKKLALLDIEKWKKILILMEGEQYNRTEINSIFNKIRKNSTKNQEFDDILEKVNLGNMYWNDFTYKGRDIVKEIIDELNINFVSRKYYR